jgi:endonuclease-3
MASSAGTRTQPRRSTRQASAQKASEATNGNGGGGQTRVRTAPVKVKREAEPVTPDPSTPTRSKRIKTEPSTTPSKLGFSTPAPSPSKSAKQTPRSKSNGSNTQSQTQTQSPADKAAVLQARKLKSFASYANKSPFPEFPHPTAPECALAHRILADLHGDRSRPETVSAPTDRAGCGNSPSVLDALIRTILSQNTSDRNSTAAKLSMDAAYGGSDRWEAIASGGQARLQKAIQCGGLSVVKSKVILQILSQVRERYGAYSLDHLFGASDDDAMREMLSFQGVGPKTASCVLLFCLKRESFAVDTHVHRLTGLLGWRPQGASREEAQAHLDATVPDEEKYPLHVLLVTHGKRCEECRAGGRNLGNCALRRAFRKGKMKGEAGEDVKVEEMEAVKKEEDPYEFVDGIA